MGISRDTIRKVKNAGASNPKPDLKEFNKTFDVTGEEVTAEELLKTIGGLAPRILKERLEAGELCLNTCGNAAAATGLKLKDFLELLITLPGQLLQTQTENESLINLNQQLQSTVDQQIDKAVITKCVNRAMLAAIMYSKGEINMNVIYGYGQFLEKMRIEDPQFFKHFRTIASEPDPLAVVEASPA